MAKKTQNSPEESSKKATTYLNSNFRISLTDKIGSLRQYYLFRISSSGNDSSGASPRTLYKGNKVYIKISRIDPKARGIQVGLVQNQKVRESFPLSIFHPINPDRLKDYYLVGEVPTVGQYSLVFRLTSLVGKEVTVVVDSIKIE